MLILLTTPCTNYEEFGIMLDIENVLKIVC